MVSAAIRERLRKMRQKYHLGEYSTKHARKSHSKVRSSYTMAKRYSKKKKSGFGNQVIKGLLGMAAGAVYAQYTPIKLGQIGDTVAAGALSKVILKTNVAAGAAMLGAWFSNDLMRLAGATGNAAGSAASAGAGMVFH